MGRIKIIHWFVYYSNGNGYGLFYKVQGIYIWKPRIRKCALIDGEWKDISEEMYPGYVFVGSEYGWRYIERFLNIQLLRESGKPKMLSRNEVREIREKEGFEENYDMGLFCYGQSVKVRKETKSPFSGMEGLFLKVVPVKGGKYAEVEFDLLGLRKRIERIPLDYLETKYDSENKTV